jgi:hypothetical protein
MTPSNLAATIALIIMLFVGGATLVDGRECRQPCAPAVPGTPGTAYAAPAVMTATAVARMTAGLPDLAVPSVTPTTTPAVRLLPLVVRE